MISNKKSIQVVSNIIMIVIVIVCMMPLLLMLISSFTAETALRENGYSFLPAELGLESYRYILKNATIILRSYGITIIVTAVGTTASLLMTIGLAYTLSRPKLLGRNVLSFFVFFTMLFNGGLVPSYIMWTQTFHVKDTIWGLILPTYLLGAFYVIMMRTYFSSSIPEEIIEAARIDGCSEIRILGRIVIPLSKSILASIGLLVGLGYWNDWMNGLYYLLRRKDLYSIQNLLNQMLKNADYLASQNNEASAMAIGAVPNTGVRMAIAVIALLPIIIIYPFIQKFFVKGIMIGGVKG